MSADLAGAPVSKGRVQVPAWGLTWADVTLAQAADFTLGSRQTLTVADVPMTMTVVSGGTYEAHSSYRLVGGRGGWGKTIPKRSYNNPVGVMAAIPLSDAAAACGEALAGIPTTRLGEHFARPEGLASAVLHTLVPRSWYVDFAGVTHCGRWPTTSYAGTATRTRVDPAAGIIELATESVAGLVPGVVVDGFKPATDVEYQITPERLTVKVWAGLADSSRLLTALERCVRSFLAADKYGKVYEFRVVAQSGERLTLQPVRAATGFDDLADVQVRPGVAGLRNQVTLGELVLVAFVDGDPSRPAVIAHDAPDSPGWMPQTIELGGPGALGVVLLGDAVQAGPYAGVTTAASARVKAVH